jgi:hypothetical protein
MAAIFPSKTEAIIALEIAISSYFGDPGPGSWVIDSGQSFISLTWVCERKQIPLNFNISTPWRELGGDEILRDSRLLHKQFVANVSGPGGYFSSALISVQDK